MWKLFDESGFGRRGFYTTIFYNSQVVQYDAPALMKPFNASYNLPAESADGDTCLHGKMVLVQYYELKPGSLMLFRHSKFGVSLCLLGYNYVPQKLLMNVFSEEKNQAIKTCNVQLLFQKVREAKDW